MSLLNSIEKKIDLGKLQGHLLDLSRPNPYIYWLDLICCALIGWTSLIFITLVHSYLLKIFFFIFATIFIYRGQSFIHEVAHFGEKLKYFEKAYNILFGYPNKFPSYIYKPHLYHHAQSTYGTSLDPEYLPWAQGSPWKLISPFFVSLILPPLLFFRFTILPFLLLFSNEKNKIWVFEHASTLVMNFFYVRKIKSKTDITQMTNQDLFCTFYSIIFIYFVFIKLIPIQIVYAWWLVLSTSSLLNMYRAKVAHRYLNAQNPISYLEQLLDSTTITGGLYTEIWAPLGLRYHALHHLMPSLPYHHLHQAHQRLVSLLPPEHPYHKTIIPNFFIAFSALIKSCRGNLCQQAYKA